MAYSCASVTAFKTFMLIVYYDTIIPNKMAFWCLMFDYIFTTENKRLSTIPVNKNLIHLYIYIYAAK